MFNELGCIFLNRAAEETASVLPTKEKRESLVFQECGLVTMADCIMHVRQTQGPTLTNIRDAVPFPGSSWVSWSRWAVWT